MHPADQIAAAPVKRRTVVDEIAEAQEAIGHAMGEGEGGVQEWVAAGLLISSADLAVRWIVRRTEIYAACLRGEVVGLKARGEHWHPVAMAQSGRIPAAAVCRALGSMPVRLKLVFWIRRHTALDGRTVIEAIEEGLLDRVVDLADRWRALLDGPANPTGRTL